MARDSVGPVIQLLSSMATKTYTDADGQVRQYLDPAKLDRRLQIVRADNYGAFVERLLHVQYIVDHAQDDFVPEMYARISSEYADLCEKYEASVSAKSAEDGELLRLLLRDESHLYQHFLAGDKKGASLRDRLFAGDRRDDRDRPEDDGGGGGQGRRDQP